MAKETSTTSTCTKHGHPAQKKRKIQFLTLPQDAKHPDAPPPDAPPSKEPFYENYLFGSVFFQQYLETNVISRRSSVKFIDPPADAFRTFCQIRDSTFETIIPLLELLGHTQESRDAKVKILPPFCRNPKMVDYGLRKHGYPSNLKNPNFSHLYAFVEAKPIGTDLDRSCSTRISPAQHLVNYLRSANDVPWGILTNGLVWRLYGHVPTQSALLNRFYQVDLRTITNLSHFRWFFHFFSRKSLCDIDGISTMALQHRAKYATTIAQESPFRKALSCLLSALYSCPSQDLNAKAILNDAVTLLMRCLCIFVAESRGVLPWRSSDIYKQISLSRLLNDIISPQIISPRFIWEALCKLFAALRCSDNFDISFHFRNCLFRKTIWETAPLRTELGKCDPFFIKFLTFLGSHPLDVIVERDEASRSLISFNDLHIHQLGSLYEELLSFQPREEERSSKSEEISLVGNQVVRLEAHAFYTPHSIVANLAKQSVDHFFSSLPHNNIDSLLNGTFRCIDPAVGSGNFLCAFVDCFSNRLSHLLDTSDHNNSLSQSNLFNQYAGNPLGPLEIRLRILQNCVFGVDVNPIAVSVAQFSVLISALDDINPNISLPSSLISETIESLERNLVHADSLCGFLSREEATAALKKDHKLYKLWQRTLHDDRFGHSELRKWILESSPLPDIDKFTIPRFVSSFLFQTLQILLDVAAIIHTPDLHRLKEFVEKMAFISSSFEYHRFLPSVQRLLNCVWPNDCTPGFHWFLRFLCDSPTFSTCLQNPPWGMLHSQPNRKDKAPISPERIRRVHANWPHSSRFTNISEFFLLLSHALVDSSLGFVGPSSLLCSASAASSRNTVFKDFKVISFQEYDQRQLFSSNKPCFALFAIRDSSKNVFSLSLRTHEGAPDEVLTLLRRFDGESLPKNLCQLSNVVQSNVGFQNLSKIRSSWRCLNTHQDIEWFQDLIPISSDAFFRKEQCDNLPSDEGSVILKRTVALNGFGPRKSRLVAWLSPVSRVACKHNNGLQLHFLHPFKAPSWKHSPSSDLPNHVLFILFFLNCRVADFQFRSFDRTDNITLPPLLRLVLPNIDSLTYRPSSVFFPCHSVADSWNKFVLPLAKNDDAAYSAVIDAVRHIRQKKHHCFVETLAEAIVCCLVQVRTLEAVDYIFQNIGKPFRDELYHCFSSNQLCLSNETVMF